MNSQELSLISLINNSINLPYKLNPELGELRDGSCFEALIDTSIDRVTGFYVPRSNGRFSHPLFDIAIVQTLDNNLITEEKRSRLDLALSSRDPVVIAFNIDSEGINVFTDRGSRTYKNVYCTDQIPDRPIISELLRSTKIQYLRFSDFLYRCPDS